MPLIISSAVGSSSLGLSVRTYYTIRALVLIFFPRTTADEKMRFANIRDQVLVTTCVVSTNDSIINNHFDGFSISHRDGNHENQQAAKCNRGWERNGAEGPRSPATPSPIISWPFSCQVIAIVCWRMALQKNKREKSNCAEPTSWLVHLHGIESVEVHDKNETISVGDTVVLLHGISWWRPSLATIIDSHKVLQPPGNF